MPDYPQQRARPDFAIDVDGTALPLAARLKVTAITVDEEVGVPTMFTLDLAGGDGQTGTGWIDGDLFAVGTAMTIALGHGDGLTDLIDGEVTALEPLFVRASHPRLRVRGYDRRHRLLRGRRTRSFTQQKDSDIAATLAGEAGLSAETEDSEVVHDYVLQANQTDLAFLETRARRIQYETLVDGRTLRFRPVQSQQGEALTLTPSDDLLDFAPHLTSMGQHGTVELRGWSPKDNAEIRASAGAGAGDAVSTMGGSDTGAALAEDAFGAATLAIGDQPVLNQAEADQLARACFNRGLLRLIRGDGTCRGRTDLHPGQVIRIDDIGTRFSGLYYVGATSHRYAADRDYRTHFTVARNAV